jgi:hypothetical protein
MGTAVDALVTDELDDGGDDDGDANGGNGGGLSSVECAGAGTTQGSTRT